MVMVKKRKPVKKQAIKPNIRKSKPVKKASKPKAQKAVRKMTLEKASKPYILVFTGGILLLLTLTGFLFSQQAKAPDSLSTLQLDTTTNNTPNIPDFARYTPKGEVRSATYTLKRGNTPVLEKTDTDWRTFARDGQWLFFHNIDMDKNDVDNLEKPLVYDLYAYNVSSNQYQSIGSVAAPSGANHLELYVMEGHLYIYAAGFKTDQATYRCELIAEVACGKPELFYSGKGRLYKSGTAFYSLFSEADAGAANYSIHLLNEMAEHTKQLGTYGFNQFDGQEVITVDGNGFIWVATYEQEGDMAQFVRLSALDNSGLRIKELLPRDIPIKDFNAASWVDNNTILLSNKNDAYVYDTVNNTFENIGVTPSDKVDKWDGEYIRRRLGITTAPYQLVYTAGDYDN